MERTNHSWSFSCNFCATNVTLSNDVIDDEQNVVNSFHDWFFDDVFTPVGKWKASFKSISDVEADEMNIYGMRDDGSIMFVLNIITHRIHVIYDGNGLF
ncbi:MAG: hypothetical protein IKH26_06935 [Bacteroidaceae bacterium]|nr:hypothetical protein [Bacteroidaceae bacterium]